MKRLHIVLTSVLLITSSCLAEDCDPKTPCNPKDCSINTPCNADVDCTPNWDNRNCEGLDKIPCEIKKSEKNVEIAAQKANCETTKTLAKANCEVTKTAANNACEAKNVADKLTCETQKAKDIVLCQAGLAGPYSCSSKEVMSQLRRAHQDALTPMEMRLGELSTPFKKASGQLSWRDTACNSSGEGVPYRNSQQSTDGICTIDIRLTSLRIDEAKLAEAGERFIRLELLNGGNATAVCSQRTISPKDIIRFSGPLKFDKHPGEKWLEVHVMNDFQVFDASELASLAPIASSSPSIVGSDKSKYMIRPGTYIVVKGNCLTRLAERAYGQPAWRKIYVANRSQIKNYNLIYPGQIFRIP